jgi:uncharacterized DUF497 family protein
VSVFAEIERCFQAYVRGETEPLNVDAVMAKAKRLHAEDEYHRLKGVVIHISYTERGDEPHIVNLRKAEKPEIRRYAKETAGYSR